MNLPILLIITLGLIPVYCKPQHAITYQFNGGRFGDTLVLYSKAKLLSYQFHCPLLFRPFTYSEHLNLHYSDIFYNKIDLNQYAQFLHVQPTQSLDTTISDTLFITSFYTETDNLYEAMIHDEQFAHQLRTCLTPTSPPLLQLKFNNAITVGVHIRKGNDFDLPLLSQQIYSAIDSNFSDPPSSQIPYADVYWPLKFPPEQFYIDCLSHLADAFPEQQFAICIFTDDPSPGLLTQRIRNAVTRPNLTFHYVPHTGQDDLDNSVIADFYALSLCDCLIRSNSSFSFAAQLLGTHKLIMYPTDFAWSDTTLYIPESTVILRSNIHGIYSKIALKNLYNYTSTLKELFS